jgi:diguanylate cyclase (GGDEF)-like protein/PAS domain S-box-containing protein
MAWPTSPTDHRSDESGRGGSRDAASGARSAPGLSSVTLIGILTIVYFTAAKFGLSMAATHKSVSLVWPPTGIALAAVLLFGYRIWPGIALGAFLANASTGVGLAVSAAIATGNTLEALAGAYLLRRLTRFRESLERPQDVLGFTALAAGVSTTVGATIGVFSLCLGGAAPWPLYATLWWQWWLGDAMGALIVAPVLLTWAAHREIAWTLRRIGEAGALLASLAVVSEMVFGGWLLGGGIGSPLAFTIFPFSIWAAMRFTQREAATATLLAFAIATWNTAREIGPFAGNTPTESFLLLQIFMGVVAVTTLVLGAAIGGHRRVEEELRKSETRARAFLESAGEGILIVDRNGRIVHANVKIEQMFGYRRDELLGQNVEVLLPERFRDVHVGHRAEYASTPRLRPMGLGLDLAGRRKDGSEFPVEISLSYTETDEGIRIMAFINDITRRKQVEEALEQANRNLSDWVNELEQRTRQTTLLGEMADLLQSCLTAEEAYAVIQAFAPKLFPSESGVLGVLGASRNLVEVVASWGDSPPTDPLFAPDRCWALRRGRPYRVDGGGSEPVCGHLGPSLPKRYLCVPMMAHGELLGLVHLQGGAAEPGQRDRAPEPLREAQEVLAVTVAERIALALANLRLRDTLRSQSILDPLTGLFNRRYMEETLDLELARAARGRRAIGIIMLDIDHFKPLNDSCGHDAGDALLRELGGLLIARVREGDIACRYGGEEFVLILPEASLELARRRAEELREAVRQLHVSHRGRIIGPITVSAGVAAFPDHGKTSAALVHAADSALYRAKSEGRDRVRVAE